MPAEEEEERTALPTPTHRQESGTGRGRSPLHAQSPRDAEMGGGHFERVVGRQRLGIGRRRKEERSGRFRRSLLLSPPRPSLKLPGDKRKSETAAVQQKKERDSRFMLFKRNPRRMLVFSYSALSKVHKKKSRSLSCQPGDWTKGAHKSNSGVGRNRFQPVPLENILPSL